LIVCEKSSIPLVFERFVLGRMLPADPPMRILLVNKYARVTGGADKHCLDLGEHLLDAGHEIRILSTADRANQSLPGAFVGRTVSHDDRANLGPGGRIVVAQRSLWNSASAQATKRLLLDFRPDIVHSHKLYPQLSVAPLWVASRFGVPIVQTLHDYEFLSASSFDSGGGWADRTEARWDYRLLNTSTAPIRRMLHRRLVTSWVSVSDYVAGVYARVGIDADVIPNFTDSQPSSPPFEHRRGVVFLGRLSPEKGVDHVIRLAECSPDLKISLAGDGELLPQTIRDASLLPNVTVLGRVGPPEALELLRRSRVVVIPSLWDEPAGLVALESMATGTPVVAYDRGGLAEYVTAAGSGSIVPSFAELRSEVSRLHSNAEPWNAASSAGIRAISNRHSPDEYVKRITAVYGQAMGCRAGAGASIWRR
jgi:glycosyltransferase involved in cell wall biosynthesis